MQGQHDGNHDLLVHGLCATIMVPSLKFLYTENETSYRKSDFRFFFNDVFKAWLLSFISKSFYTKETTIIKPRRIVPGQVDEQS